MRYREDSHRRLLTWTRRLHLHDVRSVKLDDSGHGVVLVHLRNLLHLLLEVLSPRHRCQLSLCVRPDSFLPPPCRKGKAPPADDEGAEKAIEAKRWSRCRARGGRGASSEGRREENFGSFAQMPLRGGSSSSASSASASSSGLTGGVALFTATALGATALGFALSARVRKNTVGFFHPVANDGGGGERVLWAAMRSIMTAKPQVSERPLFAALLFLPLLRTCRTSD